MVIIRIWEGLGNQLFQYAFARSLAEKGYDVKLDMDKSYDDIYIKYKNNDVRQNALNKFTISLDSINVDEYGKYQFLLRNSNKNRIIYKLSMCGLWKYKFLENKYQHYMNENEAIPKHCYIKGWFQSEKYFENIRNILLDEIKLKKKLSVPDSVSEILMNTQMTPVAVHVRRGDYVRVGLALSHMYYKKAIRYMKRKYENPFFVFFSEDHEWIQSKLSLWGCNETNSLLCQNMNLNDYEELILMSMFKSIIISNSTFSWWSAYLNQNADKIVIAPNEKYWIKEQSGIVLDDWITI